MSLGEWGEETAAEYLKNKGYHILERNFRWEAGEIDIVACEERTLVFVEVKTRRSMQYGLPCEAVTKTKQRHIKRTAEFYTTKNQMRKIERRIDVIEILCLNEKAYIRHTVNAF